MVQFKPKDDIDGHYVSMSVPGDKLTTLLPHLTPLTRYEVQVSAQYAKGDSLPVTGQQTTSEGIYLNIASDRLRSLDLLRLDGSRLNKHHLKVLHDRSPFMAASDNSFTPTYRKLITVKMYEFLSSGPIQEFSSGSVWSFINPPAALGSNHQLPCV